MSIDKTPRVVETFRMVPDRMTFDNRLKSHEIRLWCVLNFTARGRDHTDTTDAALAEMMKLSERTVQESLARLEECRFIERAPPGRRAGDHPPARGRRPRGPRAGIAGDRLTRTRGIGRPDP